MTTYGTIVHMQGEDFNEFEDVLNEFGEDAAMDYLCQWNNGEGYVSKSTQETFNLDNVWSFFRDDLIMCWSHSGQHVSLEEVVS